MDGSRLPLRLTLEAEPVLELELELELLLVLVLDREILELLCTFVIDDLELDDCANSCARTGEQIKPTKVTAPRSLFISMPSLASL